MANDLKDLLERAKAATGPDRELNGETEYLLINEGKHRVGTHAPDLPNYTGSIDVALALVERVLPGWTWTLDKFGKLPSHAPTFRCILKRPDEWLSISDAKAPTAPLAILSATLSALIQENDNAA